MQQWEGSAIVLGRKWSIWIGDVVEGVSGGERMIQSVVGQIDARPRRFGCAVTFEDCVQIGRYADKCPGMATSSGIPYSQCQTFHLLPHRSHVSHIYDSKLISTGYFVYTWGKNKYAWYNSKEGHHQMAQHEGH